MPDPKTGSHRADCSSPPLHPGGSGGRVPETVPPAADRAGEGRGSGGDIHGCREADCLRVEHLANRTDWEGGGSGQGYVVRRCRVCGDFWGVRWQYDAGTGGDDRWHRFGPNEADVRRHY